MLALLGVLPAILTAVTGLGTSASSISKSISDLHIAREKTKSDKELKEIDAQILALHDRKDVLVAEAGSRINGIIRATIALIPVPYLAKYWIWDKTIGSFRGCAGDAGQFLEHCSTHRVDGLNTEMAAILTAIIAFYFLATMRK